MSKTYPGQSFHITTTTDSQKIFQCAILENKTPTLDRDGEVDVQFAIRRRHGTSTKKIVRLTANFV